MRWVLFGFYVVLTFSLPVIVKVLSRRSLVKSGKIMDNRACKSRTQARILSTEATGRIDRDTGRGIYTSAHYEFFVNGVRYTGYDQIYGNPFNTQTVIVYYDPRDPNNNCTKFGKGQDNGTNYLIALGIVFGIIAVIILFYISIFLLFKIYG